MKIVQKAVSVVRSWLGHAGAYFTITVLLLGGLATLISGGESSFNPDYFGVAALFASVLAVCDFTLSWKVISSFGVRVILHGLLATADFVVSFVVVSKAIEGGTGLVATIVFVFIYAVIMATRSVYSSVVRRHAVDSSEYDPLFTSKPDDEK